jgi:histidinol phosphatase-like enzyme
MNYRATVSETDTLFPGRAVFLDRDGVINRPLIRGGKRYPPINLDEFEILPGVSLLSKIIVGWTG